MQDQHGKYIQLFTTIFFSFIGFIVALILLMLGLRLFFGLLSFIPGLVYAYMLFIISVPACLFISVFLVYFRRTRTHISKAVRYISYTCFSIALLAWGAAFVADIIIFFRYYYQAISHYYSYNIFLLAGSVGLIFLIGILQALSTAKEPDWMERQSG